MMLLLQREVGPAILPRRAALAQQRSPTSTNLVVSPTRSTQMDPDVCTFFFISVMNIDDQRSPTPIIISGNDLQRRRTRRRPNESNTKKLPTSLLFFDMRSLQAGWPSVAMPFQTAEESPGDDADYRVIVAITILAHR